MMDERELMARIGEVAVESEGLVVLALFTDEVRWVGGGAFCGFATDERLPRLLEVRAFDATGELHAVRDAMGQPFRVREVWGEPLDGSEPSGGDTGFCTDEWHLLDVDERRASGSSYQTTAGGRYEMVVPLARRVHLRNYWRYDEDGMAAFADFRIVGLEGGEPGDDRRD